jgi:uncharacterized protein
MRAAALRFFAVLALLFAALVPAAALDFPQLTGRVVDDAGILDSPMRRELTQKLADLEAKSTDQFVVVTLHSLQGTSIEDFGYQLGRHWAIGQKDKNNGVLLIVAPNERKVRIEVGYGLEGTLTDAVTKLIIENSILPRFRAGDMPDGIRRGTDDIISVLTGDASEWQERAKSVRSAAGDNAPWYIAVPLLTVFGGLFVFLVGCAIFQIFNILVQFLVMVHLLPPAKKRTGWRRVFNYVDGDTSPGRSSGISWSSGSSSSSSSSSSWDSGGFSGGGGSFGGGGSSGSW